MPELANFQRDSSLAVRKFVAECLEDAASASPEPAVLAAVLAVLHGLTLDSAAVVAKRAIAACSVLFKVAFAAVLDGSHTAGFPGHIEQLWVQALQVQNKPDWSDFCKLFTADLVFKCNRSGLDSQPESCLFHACEQQCMQTAWQGRENADRERDAK